ncbi:MAG TPA: V-type ATP synthase subunit B [Geopsychrobacteraceae bacterium]|nr:V-type ATP synthase subunit B [Geopsychrobacteraceae bacterium]
MRLAEHRYRSISSIRGPLVFVERVFQARIGETVTLIAPDGKELDGEVLKIDGKQALIQVFGETHGLDLDKTSVTLHDSVKRVPLSKACLGRLFNGSFEPIDGAPMYIPESWGAVSGAPINPVARGYPSEVIETGISSIDGLNTLVKGQKLPIFSSAGLPAQELVTEILRNSRLPGEGAFAVVFIALGLTFHEFNFFQRILDQMSNQFVAFINLASEPVVERLLAPRLGLTVAEDLAFNHGMDVLVVVTDITNYCDALREVSTSREELPGRRGYPGYMYSDLASLYERAGRLLGRPGSVTMLPVLTMPEDDITHPIPDLTGYITEGQLVFSRELHQKGIFPPIDVLPSLSRLMQHGIGEQQTRGDHRQIANLLYQSYAKGRDLRKLEAVVGKEGLLKEDRVMLEMADSFEATFVHQGQERRDIGQTLDLGLQLLKQYGVYPE